MIWSPKFKPPIFSHNRFKLNVSELELMLITPKPSPFLALMDLPPLPLGRALAMWLFLPSTKHELPDAQNLDLGPPLPSCVLRFSKLHHQLTVLLLILGT